MMSVTAGKGTNMATRWACHALALLGGAIVALGLPPLAWWPLIPLGIACYVIAAERVGQRGRTQFIIAALFAWGWMAPAMGWMWHLVPGGFVVAPLLFSVMHGVAAIIAVRLAPQNRSSSLTTRVVVRVALHALVECARFVTPFGGVPLAGLALGVADTRLAVLVRLVGPLGLSLWMLAVGGVLAQFVLTRHNDMIRHRSGALRVLIVLVLAQVVAQIAPSGEDTGRTLRIAAAQGGGPQGVLAINSNPRDVITRHLEATRLLKREDQLDLVVWPENAIDVRDFTTSRVREEIVSEARRLQAPFAVGITEDAGENFTNAQIIVGVDGKEASRYDKVRRVPYGEYVPLRSLLSAFGAPIDRIPRDAVSGTSRAILTLTPSAIDEQVTDTAESSNPPSVTLAVAISWEVFFSGRVNDGVAAGGEVVLNPTNGSSYTGEILQQQQVATTQLRALESGRFVIQAATTGYSVVVDSNGRVLQRIPIGKQAVIFHDVPLRSGRTVYSLIGDTTVTALILAIIFVGTWFARRTKTGATV